MSEAKSKNRVEQWLRKHFASVFNSPTWFEIVALSVLFGVHLVLGSDAAYSMSWIAFVRTSCWLLGVYGCIRVLILLGSFYERDFKGSGIRWRYWAVLAFLFIALHGTNVFVKMRFWLGQDGFTKHVEQIQFMHENGSWKENGKHFFVNWINYYDDVTVWHVEDEGRTVMFRTVDGDQVFPPPYSWWAGFMYCESGKMPGLSEVIYDHFWGPWYRWCGDS